MCQDLEARTAYGIFIVKPVPKRPAGKCRKVRGKRGEAVTTKVARSYTK
jgi:hypothetical protein